VYTHIKQALLLITHVRACSIGSRALTNTHQQNHH